MLVSPSCAHLCLFLSSFSHYLLICITCLSRTLVPFISCIQFSVCRQVLSMCTCVPTLPMDLPDVDIPVKISLKTLSLNFCLRAVSSFTYCDNDAFRPFALSDALTSNLCFINIYKTHTLTVKHSLFSSSVLLLCVYPVQPVCTSLFILLFMKLIFLTYIYIYALVLCYFYLILYFVFFCTVH